MVEYEETKFTKPLGYDNILMQQISRIAQYRSGKNIELYEESIDTLVLLLPKDIRDECLKQKEKLGVKYNISTEGKELYDKYFISVNERLEQRGMIFKTRTIKTYS